MFKARTAILKEESPYKPDPVLLLLARSPSIQICNYLQIQATYPLTRASSSQTLTTWSCFRWGLHSYLYCYRYWWSLTPPFHPYQHFCWRFAFCCTIPWIAPGGRYPPPCSVKSGLSSASPITQRKRGDPNDSR